MDPFGKVQVTPSVPVYAWVWDGSEALLEYITAGLSEPWLGITESALRGTPAGAFVTREGSEVSVLRSSRWRRVRPLPNKLTASRKNLTKVFEDRPGQELSARDILELFPNDDTSFNHDRIRKSLSELTAAGVIERVSLGVYRLAQP